MHKIEIDDAVLHRLQVEAEPFFDTPNTVLRRILGLDDENEAEQAKIASSFTELAGDDRSGSKSQGGESSRAPTGAALPVEDFMEPILKALNEAGGRAATRAVIDRVGELLEERLTAIDRKRLASGGLRWESRVQFARLRMVQSGLLKADSPRGVWELAHRGRQAIGNGGQTS
jgi:hypothetical protein